MKIILVMLNNFQAYIYDQIDHLLKFGNNDLILITDQKFAEAFSRYPMLKLYFVENLNPDYQNIVSTQQNTFRQGFWFYTSYRFTAIQLLMERENLTNLVHLENDVLLYRNLDNFKFHCQDKILLVKDSPNRCIPSLMVIPNHQILSEVMKQFKPEFNDMQNWGMDHPLISTLPIIDTPGVYGQHFEEYGAIFDGAAMGQYLGGIDPRNSSNANTDGFINETCEIKYDKYQFTWENGQPYLITDSGKIPILCLHIHSKNLKRFSKF